LYILAIKVAAPISIIPGKEIKIFIHIKILLVTEEN
jgi:hypothetical protein